MLIIWGMMIVEIFLFFFFGLFRAALWYREVPRLGVE